MLSDTSDMLVILSYLGNDNGLEITGAIIPYKVVNYVFQNFILMCDTIKISRKRP